MTTGKALLLLFAIIGVYAVGKVLWDWASEAVAEYFNDEGGSNGV